jgi:GNAT superfamily N-acetyltransferase
MVNMPMFYVTELNNANRDQFKKLAATPLHPLLEPTYPQANCVVLGVGVEDRIVGMFIALPSDEHDHSYTIACLWVLTTYHKHGIDNMLLVAGEKILRTRGASQIDMAVNLPYHLQDAQTFLNLLQELGWNEIRLRDTVFYIHDQNIAQEPWFRLQVPDGYELFCWKDLSPQEKAALQTQPHTYNNDKRGYLDPFVVDPFDPHTSLGMRHKASGRVVGWMINEVQTPELLCFRRLFIIPAARNQRLFYPLLANSIQRYFQYYPQATFNVAADNPTMRAAIIRMMGHRCDAILENYYCRKALRPEYGNSDRVS